MVLLDASALLTFLFQGPGHDRGTSVLHGSYLSTVNLSEVLGRFARDGIPVAPTLAQFEAHQIHFLPFSPQDARIAAELLPIGRPVGLSLADRACLAVAINRQLPVYTADQLWLSLPRLGIEITCIR